MIKRSNGVLQATDSKMYFQIRIKTPLTSTDKIQVEFPANTVYSSNYDSSVDLNAYKLNNLESKTRDSQLSSLTQTFKTDDQSKYYLATLVISSFCPSGCPADSYLYFEVDTFQNPLRLRSDLNTLLYTISTVDSNNYFIDQSTLNAKYVLVPLSGFPLASATLGRALSTVNAATLVTVSLKAATFKVIKDSQVNLMIPLSQFLLASTSGLTCTNTVSNTVIPNCYLTQTATHLNVTFTEFCSSGSDCSVDTTLAFSISGLKNAPYNPSPSFANSVTINLLQDYRHLYASVSGIFPTPNIKTSLFLTDLSMTRSSDVAGTETTLTMRFRVPVDLPTSTKVFLQLPPYAFYKSSTSKCQNENGKDLTCSFQENSDPSDTRRINSYVS